MRQHDTALDKFANKSEIILISTLQ